MVCTYCGHETEVANSRPQRRSNSIWRRRRCIACGSVFTTTEQIDYEKSWVVQAASGELRPFLRDKLFVSLYKSLGHRPTAAADATALTATIMGRLQQTTQSAVVTPQSIIQTSTEVLQRFDKAAATTYQAYHSDVG